MLIEEAEGLANALEIAQASDRLEALIFGAGDLSASLHARVDGNFDPVVEYPGDFWHFARVQVLTAARAGLVDAIDAPYPGYQDPEGYRRVGAAGQRCSASTASGPSTPARCRSPTRSSRRRPRRWPRPRRPCEAYRDAEAGGVGAIGRDGRLVDAAHMRLAANTLHKASLAGGERPARPGPGLTAGHPDSGNALLIQLRAMLSSAARRRRLRREDPLMARWPKPAEGQLDRALRARAPSPSPTRTPSRPSSTSSSARRSSSGPG